MKDNELLNRSSFVYNLNEKINLGEFIYCKDGSLLYSNNCGDFAILPAGNWRFELLIDSKNGKCICVQAFLSNLQYKNSSLNLPINQKGEIIFKSIEKLKPAFGSHYFPFKDEVYYDKDKKIICFGEKDALGIAIEFANKTIAVIDNGQLVSIYLNLEEISMI